jgi:hypothetical protein
MSGGERAMQKARRGFPPGLPAQFRQIALYDMIDVTQQAKLDFRDIRRIPGTTFPSAPPSCRSRCRRKFARRRMSDSLRLNAGRLNDRPPFLDLCLMKCADSVCGPQVRGRKLQTSIG